MHNVRNITQTIIIVYKKKFFQYKQLLLLDHSLRMNEILCNGNYRLYVKCSSLNI